MKQCKRCGVRIAENTMACPLCRGVLSQEQTEDPRAQYVAGYPDVKKKTRRFQKTGRILLFLAIALEVVLVFINYMTYEKFPKSWSMISGGVLAYLILTLWDVLGQRKGHIREIYKQIFVIMALLLLIDYSVGWIGWSLEFGLPCIIYGLVAAIVICMAVNSSSWQNYVLMQLAAILLSVMDAVLNFAGVLHHIVLAWIALGLSVLLWSGTMIIGDRKARNELKRKLHI